MTKYRIVSRNRSLSGSYRVDNYYYLQVKLFGLFWIDYHYNPFTSTCNSYSSNIETVEQFYEELMASKKVEQKVVKTFYDTSS